MDKPTSFNIFCDFFNITLIFICIASYMHASWQDSSSCSSSCRCYHHSYNHTVITIYLERLVLVKQLSWQPCLQPPPLPPAPMRYCPLPFSSCHRFQNAMIFATEILPTSLFSCHFLQQQCLLPKWKYYKRLMNIFLKILIADKKTLLLLICGLKEGRLYKVSQGLNGVLAQNVCLPKI